MGTSINLIGSKLAQRSFKGGSYWKKKYQSKHREKEIQRDKEKTIPFGMRKVVTVVSGGKGGNTLAVSIT
jgi:hypothetical protein